ncbi:MAG: DNA mismatch repair endonuclease MutL [Saprospirales bacterium]|nr:MAG: DNA mismatch repair endonuclease MutL [Saprospirales bacterium]
MSNIIKLLPDHVANQIAAGEVIQRPASVVKELMENAIDAGADDIQLILKDSGKKLIQVVDNGRGMNESDARLAFERHATSKISSGEDLFNIHTMGFRGEALASIAAVAHVELISRQPEDEIGTKILIEGSEVTAQEPFAAVPGTSLSVKNLFYNVPARRKFLKSDRVELRRIIQEFERIALGFPDVKFTLLNDDKELVRVHRGSQKDRILGLFGKKLNEKLFPIQEETEFLKLSGFCVKPQFCKKSRKEQFLFLNKRFFKSGYLHHAIKGAYEGLLQPDQNPSYFLFLEMDPGLVDVNVHPTKQEIKFSDERDIYHMVRVAVRHGLGKHQLTPTLDFDVERGQRDIASGQTAGNRQQSEHGEGGGFFAPRPKRDSGGDNWAHIFEGVRKEMTEQPGASQIEIEGDLKKGEGDYRNFFQVLNRYVVVATNRGLALIDQRAAHEQMLYEEFAQSIERDEGSTQNLLFPKTVEVPASDSTVLQEILPSLQKSGFQLEHFGGNTFVIHGVPAIWTKELDPGDMLAEILENYKLKGDFKDSGKRIARSLAGSLRISAVKKLSEKEMKTLIDKVLNRPPSLDLLHKKQLVWLDEEGLAKLFKR